MRREFESLWGHMILNNPIPKSERPKTYLTISDDFNSPSEPDGTRKTLIWPSWHHKPLEDGRYEKVWDEPDMYGEPGDPVVAYFDPGYDRKYGHNAGFSMFGTLISIEPGKPDEDGSPIYWVTYRIDEEATLSVKP